MSITKISDLIVPEVFNPYVIQRTTELSAFYQSGVLSTLPEYTGAYKGGETVNVPFFNDITGVDEVISESTPATPDKITAGNDIAVVHGRQKAFGASDLSKQLSGADPMMAFADLVADYWARRLQAALISTLKGTFLSASMSSKVADVSGAALPADNSINKNTFIDALGLMGDMQDRITAVAMHSATFNYLKKKELTDTLLPSADVAFATYQGKRVIIDDSLPVAAGVYTTYLFGEGAIGFADLPAKMPLIETDRDILAGEDYVNTRKIFLLHPRGVKWTGSVIPANATLETGTNWTRVYEPKNIRIVQFKHKLA